MCDRADGGESASGVRRISHPAWKKRITALHSSANHFAALCAVSQPWYNGSSVHPRQLRCCVNGREDMRGALRKKKRTISRVAARRSWHIQRYIGRSFELACRRTAFGHESLRWQRVRFIRSRRGRRAERQDAREVIARKHGSGIRNI